MQQTHKAALLILDGWGIGPQDASVNAIYAAHTPFMDSLLANYPNATLQTSGEVVGLPPGQMGNSEVGHLNIGAGRIVYQMLMRINKALTEDELARHSRLLDIFNNVKASGKKLHLLGLVSDGGVHSHIDHLKGLATLASEHGLEQVYIHAFSDGRDTDPRSGVDFLSSLEEHLRSTTGCIASVIGRYYAMDRDKRWERVKKAYDLLVNGEGEHAPSPKAALENSYEKGITDEFIQPHIIGDKAVKIEDGDYVLFFNFRTDRGRQLTEALSQKAFPEYGMRPLNLHYTTLTVYDKTFSNVHTLFGEDDLSMTLGEVVSKAGKTQLRIAETEKYPHVTFFFSGGKETAWEGESRIMIPSPKVPTYDLQPKMSAPELADAVINYVREHHPDLVVLNFANPDMVGHTGVFSAVVEAMETIDHHLKQIVEVMQGLDYRILIIADHGNADFMVNPDGTPNTAHTTNPVPAILLTPEKKQIRSGILADVSPTLLQLMNLPQPPEMTGKSLLV